MAPKICNRVLVSYFSLIIIYFLLIYFDSGLKQLPVTHIHIVSSISGQNIKATMKDIDSFRRGRDLYIIGPVNCGKSSFINSALLHVGIGGIKVLNIVFFSFLSQF